MYIEINKPQICDYIMPDVAVSRMCLVVCNSGCTQYVIVACCTQQVLFAASLYI